MPAVNTTMVPCIHHHHHSHTHFLEAAHCVSLLQLVKYCLLVIRILDVLSQRLDPLLPLGTRLQIQDIFLFSIRARHCRM